MHYIIDVIFHADAVAAAMLAASAALIYADFIIFFLPIAILSFSLRCCRYAFIAFSPLLSP